MTRPNVHTPMRELANDYRAGEFALTKLNKGDVIALMRNLKAGSLETLLSLRYEDLLQEEKEGSPQSTGSLETLARLRCEALLK